MNFRTFRAGSQLKFLLIGLALSLQSSCSLLPDKQTSREPAQDNQFLTVRTRLQTELLQDQNKAKSPEHATRVLDQGVRTEKAILILHGLHESPAYMQGFSNYFHSKGYNVLALRLPGHLSAQPEDLNTVSAQQWIDSVEKAFQEVQLLGEHVEILGYSTGGTLAVYLALKHPESVKALYLISPALALSNRVFASTRFAGIPELDLNLICQKNKSPSRLCRVALQSDPELKLMLQEGLQTSLPAGAQVQVLIEKILQQFDPGPLSPELSNETYYQQLESTYLQMRTPLLMVNSEADTVVLPKFNQALMKKYLGPHSSVYFAKDLKITHLMMNKSSLDAFHVAPQTANPRFQEILQNIESFAADIN